MKYIRRSHSRNYACTQGSFVLLAAVALVFIAGATSVITLLSGHHQTRARLQRSLDEVVLLAARDLPHTESVRRKIPQLLSTLVPSPTGIQADISSARVSLTLEFTEQFFAPLRSGVSQPFTFRYSLTSRGALSPQHTMILLDTGGYTAPPLLEVGADESLRIPSRFWGAPSPSHPRLDPWGESTLLSTHQSPQFFLHGALRTNGSINSDASHWENLPRLITQQCFNPTLMAMKEGALRLYDSLSAVSTTKLSVLVGPVFTRGSDSLPSTYSFLPLQILSESADKPHTQFIENSSTITSNALCLGIAAHAARSGDLRYALPERSSALPPSSDRSLSENEPSYRVPIQIDGRNYFDFRVSTSTRSRIGVRTALWSLPASQRYTDELHPLPAQPNISTVLSSVKHYLLSTLPTPNASAPPTSTAYLIMGDLPWESDRRIVRHAKSVTPCNSDTAPWTCWRNHTSSQVEAALRNSLQELDSFAEQLGVPRATIYYIYAKHPGIYPERVGTATSSMIIPYLPPLQPFSDSSDRPYLCLDEGAQGLITECEQFVRESEYFATLVKNINEELDRIEMIVIRLADTQRFPFSFAAFAPLQGRSVVLTK